MKTEDLEIVFYKVLDLPLAYGYRLTNLDYLNLIALAFGFNNVKELRQETLKKLMNEKDEDLKARIRKILKVN